MSSVVPFRARMTADEAIRRIRKAADRDDIGWCDHALEKLGDQIVMRQALTVIREGELRKGPTWNQEYGDWVCVLRAVTSGRRVHVVIGIYEEESEVTVITVY